MTLCKHFMFKKKYLLNYRLLLWIAKGKIVLMDLTVNMCEITRIIDCEWLQRKTRNHTETIQCIYCMLRIFNACPHEFEKWCQSSYNNIF